MMRWQDHIQRALQTQVTHSIEDVERMVETGEAQLWQGQKSAAVTEIIQFPRIKVLHLWLCGGDLREITEDMLPKAERFARAEGCQRLTTAGRIGWDRVMKKHGFTPIASVCAKDLH